MHDLHHEFILLTQVYLVIFLLNKHYFFIDLILHQD